MERLPYKMNVNAPSFPPQAGALSHNHAQERLPSCPFPASFYHPSVCCACAPQPPPLKTLRLFKGGKDRKSALATIMLRKQGCPCYNHAAQAGLPCAARLNLPLTRLSRKGVAARVIIVAIARRRKTECRAAGERWVFLKLTGILFVSSKRIS